MTGGASNLGARRASGMIPAVAVPSSGVSQMTEEKWRELEEDFRTWSGGFPPESEFQIIVYIDYANPFPDREQKVKEYLMDWYEQGDDDFIATFEQNIGRER
jgi:hypothetical protein